MHWGQELFAWQLDEQVEGRGGRSTPSWIIFSLLISEKLLKASSMPCNVGSRGLIRINKNHANSSHYYVCGTLARRDANHYTSASYYTSASRHISYHRSK